MPRTYRSINSFEKHFDDNKYSAYHHVSVLLQFELCLKCHYSLLGGFMAPQIDPFCKFSVSITGSPPGASHWLLWRHRLHELMDSWLWGRGPVSGVFLGSDTP